MAKKRKRKPHHKPKQNTKPMTDDTPIIPDSNKKRDQGVKSNSNTDTPKNHCTCHFDAPQPFIVKVEKEKKKWIKRLEPKDIIA